MTFHHQSATPEFWNWIYISNILLRLIQYFHTARLTFLLFPFDKILIPLQQSNFLLNGLILIQSFLCYQCILPLISHFAVLFPQSHNKYYWWRGVLFYRIYPELKYETSRPRDFISFDLLEKSDTTPRLTSVFRKRPSHIRETSLFVEALAFTTPRTSVGWMGGTEGCEGKFNTSLKDGVGWRRSHHSAPIVHSLSKL